MEIKRDQIIETSKNFKTSWMELGEHLTNVAREKKYIEWGFSCFEEYCRNELKLKKSTAMKLTNAYFFIEKEEPELKEKAIDFDSINTLQKIKSNDNCSPEMFDEIKKDAIKGKSSQTLAKRFKDLIKEPESDAIVFYRQSTDLAKRLLSKIKPVPNIQDRYKETLGEMIANFDAVISEIENNG